MTATYAAVGVLWLLCTTFFVQFIYHQLPTMAQDSAVSIVAMAVALSYWWMS